MRRPVNYLMPYNERSTYGVVVIGSSAATRASVSSNVSTRWRDPNAPSMSIPDRPGSVEWARDRGVEVVQLDMSHGFTAARARNAGFARLRELAPQQEYVQLFSLSMVIANCGRSGRVTRSHSCVRTGRSVRFLVDEESVIPIDRSYASGDRPRSGRFGR